MISYDGLTRLLKQNGLKKSELTKKIGISSRTIAKISKGEKIADNVILRLCEFFGCKKGFLTERKARDIINCNRQRANYAFLRQTLKFFKKEEKNANL